MGPSDVRNHYTIFTVLEGICYMLNFIWSVSWINFSYIILFAVGSHDNPQKSLCMSVGCGSVVPCRHQPDRQAHCVWHSCWPLTFLFPLRICVDVSRRYVFYQSNFYWTVHHCNGWRMKDKLDVTCYFYFTSFALSMFRTLIYPSSGACDCVVELPHRSSCSVKTDDLALV